MKTDSMGLRGLTPGEIELAKRVYGGAIDYSQVNIFPNERYAPGQGQNETVTPDGNMYFPPGSKQYRDDFSTSDNKCHFMHEMMHVYQKQVLHYWMVMDAVAGYIGVSNDFDYDYELTPGKSLFDYSNEQQAAIVADYFGLAYGIRDPTHNVGVISGLPAYGQVVAPLLPPINIQR